MSVLIAHKAQVVLVASGTVIQMPKGDQDTVREERGVQCGNTFFMTPSAWEETKGKDQSLEALVLVPAAEANG